MQAYVNVWEMLKLDNCVMMFAKSSFLKSQSRHLCKLKLHLQEQTKQSHFHSQMKRASLGLLIVLLQPHNAKLYQQ